MSIGDALTNIIPVFGWSLYIDRMDMTVTPSVSVNGARISSSRLQGKDRAAELMLSG